MQNVLNFPTVASVKPKRSLVEKIQNFIKNRKIQKEKIFKRKTDFLIQQTYEIYLDKILKNRREKESVDFAEWLYKQGFIIDQGAYSMAKESVNWVQKVYGRKHIEKCYKARLKEIQNHK